MFKTQQAEFHWKHYGQQGALLQTGPANKIWVIKSMLRRCLQPDLIVGQF